MRKTKILVVDPDLHTLADFRHAATELNLEVSDSERREFLGEVDVIGTQSFSHAREVMATERGSDSPIAVAFLDAGNAPDYRGIETAKILRVLDEDLYVVILSRSRTAEIQQRFADLGRSEYVSYLAKPLENIEMKSWMTGLTDRWWTNRKALVNAASQPPHLAKDLISDLSVAAAFFDRKRVLRVANDAMIALYPEISSLFQAGTHIDEIEEALYRLAGTKPTVNRAGHKCSYTLTLGPDRQLMVYTTEIPSGGVFWLHCQVGAVLERERALMLRAMLTAAGTRKADIPRQQGLHRPQEGGVETEEKIITLSTTGRLAPDPDQVRKHLLNGDALHKSVLRDLRHVITEKLDELYRGSEQVIEPEFACSGRIWPVEIPVLEFGVVLEEITKLQQRHHNYRDTLFIDIDNVVVDEDFSYTRPGLTTSDYVRISFRDILSNDALPSLSSYQEIDPLTKQFALQISQCLSGLSLANAFATSAGGYMEIESQQDGNASVNFYLPRAHRLNGVDSDLRREGQQRTLSLPF
jgi:hypothetical protein